MNRKLLALLLGAACGLSACVSAPTQYLALTPRSAPAEEAPLASVQNKGLPLLVAHVQMPADLDRLYLTYEQDKDHFRVADHVRWIAPLGEMAQRVLAQDLAATLAHKTVLMPGDPSPSGPYLILRVVVQRFMPADSGQVQLRADWFVQNASTQHILAQGRSDLQTTSGDHPSDQAAAMSRLLGDLAQTIAARMPQP
ncbi:MAG TPA: PqiC family protein [Acidiferrobacter sp.]|nr:PqiC family protein [Acidiferrobacter sp.]